MRFTNEKLEKEFFKWLYPYDDIETCYNYWVRKRQSEQFGLIQEFCVNKKPKSDIFDVYGTHIMTPQEFNEAQIQAFNHLQKEY